MRRFLLVLLVSALACARATTPPVDVVIAPAFAGRPITRLAILPALRAATASDLPDDALETVTELLTRAASREKPWEVIAPETVSAALRGKVTPPIEPEALAAAAAGETGADAALGVLVSRFHERVGSAYGVSEPASVALRMFVIRKGEAEAGWRADYSFTQEPLSYNLWNFWGVLRGGPRWLTAAELARIGIDEAVSRLARPKG